jgi:spermidine synthase
MKTARILDRVRGEGQSYLVLSEHHGFLTVSVDEKVLMSSAAHGSEERMAIRALGGGGKRRKARRVLVGGLGLGYTLRAALDLSGEADRVEVAELLPAIVRWHEEGPLGELAGHPLKDPRVTLRRGDVREVLASEPERYDAILLDVDNGPTPMVSKANARLYDDAGARLCAAALARGGMLVTWSARPDEGYVRRLRAAGLTANAEKTGAEHRSDPSLEHWLFVAVKP